MIIVLDANVLSSDFAMRSPAYTVLASAVINGDVRVIVPESVVQEVVGNWQRELEARERELRKWRKEAGRSAFVDPHIDEIIVQIVDATSSCKKRLSDLLNSLAAEVAPYPSVTHEKLVERAVLRKKPCNDNGDGYRDSLIWHTILELAEDVTEEIVFITKDTDFVNKNGDLHAVLQAELAEGRDAAVRSVSDVATLVATEILKLTPSDEMEAKRLISSEVNERMIDLLVEAIADDLADYDIRIRDVGLPPPTERVEINYVENPSDLKLKNRRPIDNGSEVWSFEITVMSGLDVLIGTDAAQMYDLISSDETDRDKVKVRVLKNLVVEGLMRSDSLFTQITAEVLVVHATDDDPGLWDWEPPDSCVGVRR